MFMISLKFAENKAEAPAHMDAHNQWIQQGFDDGVFLLVGSLQPNLGGAILAQAGSRADIEARVRQDPFVAAGVVNAEIAEITPARRDPRLEFLMD